MTSFYSDDELLIIGFKHIGKGNQISRKASFYGVSRISIGNNTRIDDYCVLSAGTEGIMIGDYVHIAVYSSLQGDGWILMEDFSTLSSKVTVYSSNSNYSGEFMVSPLLPKELIKNHVAPVLIKEHALVGTGSVILPGVTLNYGVVIGAMSLVKKDCDAFYVYAGVPVRKIKKRSRNLLKLKALI